MKILVVFRWKSTTKNPNKEKVPKAQFCTMAAAGTPPKKLQTKFLPKSVPYLCTNPVLENTLSSPVN